MKCARVTRHEQSLADGGAWLRCALHAHTTNSDGELAPRKLVKHYERAGYDVLAVTDHWHRSDAPSTDGVLVLPGAELNCLLPGDRDGHVLALGIEDSLGELEGERRDLAETADWIVRNGGVAYLAHPILDGCRRAGTLELPETVSGIEVFNAGCELEVGRGLSAVHWDEILGSGRRCFALGNRRHPSSRLRLRSRVDVGARCAHAKRACSTRSAPGASTRAPVR